MNWLLNSYDLNSNLNITYFAITIDIFINGKLIAHDIKKDLVHRCNMYFKREITHINILENIKIETMLGTNINSMSRLQKDYLNVDNTVNISLENLCEFETDFNTVSSTL